MRLVLALAIAAAALLAPASSNAAMLTESVCADLARQEAKGPVAYQPGVTVRGGRVVQADLRPKDDPAPYPTTVDVSVLLKDRLFVPARPNQLRGEVPVTRFVVRRDGVVTYAGQPLPADVQQNVSAICRRAWGERILRQ